MRSNFVGKRIRILFVCPSFSSFIQNDLDTLSRHFDVRVAHYQGKKKLLKFLIEMLKGVLWADLTFSWFAGTVDFSSENTISSSFTAECAENAEASEIPNVDWSVLKLCALGDLRGGKSLGF